MKRCDVKDVLENADLTAREREIIYQQELEKTLSIKELSSEYNVEERHILRIKQKALFKIGQYLGII